MTNPLIIKEPGALATARRLEAMQIAIREMQQFEADLKTDLKSIAAWHGKSVRIGSFLIESYPGEYVPMYAITGGEE
jgi:hypothetical protein